MVLPSTLFYSQLHEVQALSAAWSGCLTGVEDVDTGQVRATIQSTELRRVETHWNYNAQTNIAVRGTCIISPILECQPPPHMHQNPNTPPNPPLSIKSIHCNSKYFYFRWKNSHTPRPIQQSHLSTASRLYRLSSLTVGTIHPITQSRWGHNTCHRKIFLLGYGLEKAVDMFLWTKFGRPDQRGKLGGQLWRGARIMPQDKCWSDTSMWLAGQP